MERETDNRDLSDDHDENLQTEAESLKQETHKTSHNATRKKNGATSAFRAASDKARSGKKGRPKSSGT